MRSERCEGQPADGRTPFGGGHNQQPARAPLAAHPPPVAEQEGALSALGTLPGGDVFNARVAGNEFSKPSNHGWEQAEARIAGEIADAATREAERQARYRERRLARYRELRAGVLRGDEEAVQWWERVKGQKRAWAHRRREEQPEQAVEIVDIAKLEAEKRERQRAQNRASSRRYYHKTKQAALAGDEEAQIRWERIKQHNREGTRRWQAKYPEKRRAYEREWRKREKTLEAAAAEILDTPFDVQPHSDYIEGDVFSAAVARERPEKPNN